MAKTKTEKPKTSGIIWKQRFETCQDNQAKIFNDTKKYYDIMYAVFNTKNMAPWRSKVYVPILASKAWDLIARMSDVVPLFDITIKNELEIGEDGNFQIPEDVRQREKIVEAKLQYDYSHNGDEPMKLRVFDPLVDAVVAGTGYAYATWCTEKKKSYARPIDDETGMIADNENVIVKEFTDGYNDFEGINFYNVFPAKSPSFWTAPYLIIRGFKPKVDLEKTGLYENLDVVNTEVKKGTFDEFNISRNRVVNRNDFQVDDTVDMVTYYECYERTTEGIELTTYAEGEDPETGWVTIRPSSYPYWHNMFPVVPFYCRKKSYSSFGESLFENNRTLQSATNDLFNHYLDNWNLSIDSMLMYEDGSLTNDFVVEPGGEITFTGEAPKQFKFPEPNPQQLSTVMNTLSQAIEAATVPQYLSGVPNSQLDKTQGTATGVSKITEAATEKVGFFRDNFKQSMTVVGRIQLSNLQQFMDNPAEVRMNMDGKEVPAIALPGDFQGELELEIDDDSMTPVTKSDRRDMTLAFIQQVSGLQDQAMKQAQVFGTPEDIPRLNFTEMINGVGDVYSIRNVDRILLDNKDAIAKMQQAAQSQSGQPERPPIENINYKDAPPDVKAQMEQQAGLQPSATHEQDMQVSAANVGDQLAATLDPNMNTSGAQSIMQQSPQAQGLGNGQ